MKLQQLLSLTRKAVDEYQMIETGDRIAVGISGGKDSCNAVRSARSQRFYPHFLNCTVTVDLGYENLISENSCLCETLRFLIR